MVTTELRGFTFKEMREFLDFLYPDGAPSNFLGDYFDLKGGLWYVKSTKTAQMQTLKMCHSRFLGNSKGEF